MDDLVNVVFLTLGLVVPVAAFVFAKRQVHLAARDLVLLPGLAGAAVGVLFLLSVVAMDGRQVGNPALYPWLLVFTTQGLVIGTMGVIARLVGGWRPRRW